jgi:hypothetical protein
VPEQLNLAGLSRFCGVVPWVVLILLKDQASANLLLVAHAATNLVSEAMLVLSPTCTIHNVFRAVLVTLQRMGVHGPLYSLAQFFVFPIIGIV